MSAPPIRFFGDGLEVILAGHDLPEPPIQWGGTHRKTVTKYANDWVSMQSHGIDYDPIEIEGELKDQRWGHEGYAQRMRGNLEALMQARTIVLLEYAEDKLWGSFDVSFEEVRRDYVRYVVRFEPYWREDPKFQTFFAFESSPATAAASLRTRVDDMVAHGTNPPSSFADTKFLATARLELLSAQNSLNSALGVLDKVATFQEMTIDTHKLVIRGLKQSVNAIQRGLQRNAKLSVEAVSLPGAHVAAASDWVWTLQRKQRLSRKELFDLLRRILGVTRPVSRKRVIVRDGDTLQRIAERELGDFNRWVDIADANDLETPDIYVGQLLVVPRR